MKKMWKLNNKAVSPVIATILMVAITVVLAAVLYVMVMGFGGEADESPTASLTAATTASAHTEKVTLASISEAMDYENFQVSVVINGIAYAADLASGNLTTALNPAAGYYVNFVDLAADGQLSAGDYFLVESTTGGATISLNLLYGADADSIASDEWNQP
jgi:flagellin-like protein